MTQPFGNSAFWVDNKNMLTLIKTLRANLMPPEGFMLGISMSVVYSGFGIRNMIRAVKTALIDSIEHTRRGAAGSGACPSLLVTNSLLKMKSMV